MALGGVSRINGTTGEDHLFLEYRNQSHNFLWLSTDDRNHFSTGLHIKPDIMALLLMCNEPLWLVMNGIAFVRVDKYSLNKDYSVNILYLYYQTSGKHFGIFCMIQAVLGKLVLSISMEFEKNC